MSPKAKVAAHRDLVPEALMVMDNLAEAMRRYANSTDSSDDSEDRVIYWRSRLCALMGALTPNWPLQATDAYEDYVRAWTSCDMRQHSGRAE